MSSLEIGQNTSSTLERIEAVVRSLLANDAIALTPETQPADVPGWDSLANVNIVFAIEEEFGIQFADEDLTAAHTVGELAARVDRARAA